MLKPMEKVEAKDWHAFQTYLSRVQKVYPQNKEEKSEEKEKQERKKKYASR